MGFDTQDLLRQSGYSEGDRLVVLKADVNKQRSTTSGSFTSLTAPTNKVLTDLSHIPDDATLTAQLTVQSGTTMDADGDYRAAVADQTSSARVTTPSVTISSGNTFGIAQSDRVTVDLRSVVNLVFEFRSDGTNTVSIFEGSLLLQVEL